MTNNVTMINRNYNYDAARFQPHVGRFYGWQAPYWGNHWRYGYFPSPAFGLSVSVGVGFGFGFYAYTPFYAPVVASPFYYDPYVPAYIPEARVAVWSGYSVPWSYGEPYSYVETSAYNTYGDPALNYGVYSIGMVYRHHHPEMIADILGSGQVAIFSRGHYEYSLDSQDFQAMMADNCAASRTVSLDLVSVRHHGPIAYVRYRHRYLLSDGGPHTAYLVYRMQLVGDRYAVTDFMTSDSLM